MKFEEYKSRTDEIISVPIPESYKDCVEMIRSDFFRYYGVQTGLFSMFLKTLTSPPFALTFWLRLAQIKGCFYWIAKIIHRHYSQKFGFQIFPSMKIGYGFCLGHAIDIIINPYTVIGNNVCIDQFVNIGSTKNTFAVIGNNVHIFPMSCVVNDVHIGSNATIGAGAVVVKDVPKDATVAGAPAKVLNYNRPGHFIGNKWPLPQDKV